MDLRKLIDPIEPATFPDGTVHELKPFDAIMWRKYRELKASPDADEAGKELFRLCVPTATDDDIETLNPKMMQAIVLQCMGKAELALELLKNFEGDRTDPTNDSRASIPSTTPSMSSAESGASLAAVLSPA